MNVKFYTVFFRTASLISFLRIVVAQVPLEFHNEVIHASDYGRLFCGLMLCVVLSTSIYVGRVRFTTESIKRMIEKSVFEKR